MGTPPLTDQLWDSFFRSVFERGTQPDALPEGWGLLGSSLRPRFNDKLVSEKVLGFLMSLRRAVSAICGKPGTDAHKLSAIDSRLRTPQFRDAVFRATNASASASLWNNDRLARLLAGILFSGDFDGDSLAVADLVPRLIQLSEPEFRALVRISQACDAGKREGASAERVSDTDLATHCRKLATLGFVEAIVETSPTGGACANPFRPTALGKRLLSLTWEDS
jgi:hypothetical protein